MPAVVRAREDSVRTARPSRALLMSALAGASPGALGDPGSAAWPLASSRTRLCSPSFCGPGDPSSSCPPSSPRPSLTSAGKVMGGVGVTLPVRCQHPGDKLGKAWALARCPDCGSREGPGFLATCPALHPRTTFMPHPHPHNRDALGDRDALGATQTQLAHCCFAAAFWEARMTLWAAIWNSPERACDNGSTVPRRIEAAPLPWFPRANRSPVASQWQPELGTLSESKGEAITSEHGPGQDLPSSSFTCFHQGAGSCDHTDGLPKHDGNLFPVPLTAGQAVVKPVSPART
ncbi:uncharacterized protein [Pseudorca crassidens]|uniref:uncharacterized protein n=1 Tax=Pseudorca crassidens TaxID=82174 RepID=UPI00352DC203